ncbi:hypothetical protein [Legionella longbeachae]|uniref:Uncharacterized protein n=1 Tax=Legionella longbeachae serogroup 1 (strain NSW150) TaxID=661367 RepID=D3HKN9_LEGLN|nr:hypothetical protein [Legionella longbeachae]VEE03521.1 Uncharacterised protein [Legionella oakridgensis]ARB93590.1 hypothetical protein A6J40_16050 [Legionella longbeachae]ARM33272.1 hypothetical protein B0B39_06925 [Legionella longbeachae]EEZ93867.1 conserved hypothetical protein [Legionella longbeachae D-4968]QIN33225.1 hypothetical protein GCB94_14265 [Legionella longbeachae]
MPKAFTHLCKNVNLSLYDNTLTVYTKSKMSFPPIRTELDLLMVLLFSQMDCVSAQIDKMFDMRKNELGVYRFVHRDDYDHHLYHQDNFNMDDNHYHAQFAKTIDEIKLEDILGILEKHNLISSEEHESFIRAYHEANTIPLDLTSSTKVVFIEQEKSQVAPGDTPSKKPSVKQKDDEVTFGGFRRGFFLAASSKTVVTKKEDSKTSGLNNFC